MSLNLPPLRPLPSDTAAWGAKELLPDDPYRRIGDEVYPSLYDLYAEEFVGVPAPKGLTPVDLAFIVALGGQHDLSVDATAERLRTDPAWKYALHLPLDHPGCPGDALWRFVKRTDGPRCPQRGPIGFIIAMVRMAFTPRR
jgi:Transposase domain (DUF772)